MEGERGADGDENGRLEERAHVRHPEILFRGSEPDPDHVRARGVDPGGRFASLVFRERTEGRDFGAADPQAGEPCEHVFAQAARGLFVRPAVEIVAQAGGAAGVQHVEHDVRSVAAVHGQVRGAAAEEHEGHAVAERHRRRARDGGEARVVAALEDGVDREDADVAALAGAGHADDFRDGLRAAASGERDVEDAETRKARGGWRFGAQRTSSSRMLAGTKSVSQPVTVTCQSSSSSRPASSS